MPPVLLDGEKTSAAIIAEVAEEVSRLSVNQELKAQGFTRPGLAVVLVGNDPASVIYTRKKKEASEKIGFRSTLVQLPETISEDYLLAEIDLLNDSLSVDGILCQLPLPKHINKDKVIKRIDPSKDVDGFHPFNFGLLASGHPRLVPCTPLGCQELLVRYGIPTTGAHVVIVGRSQIVGMPLALLLSQKSDRGNATVTICHSHTKNLEAVCATADILVAAIGQPQLIKADWVKPGATVIDVGINRIPDVSKKSGFRLVGDVDYQDVLPKVSAITPVPGGVGPMTVAMLLRNTLNSVKSRWLPEEPEK